MAYNIAKNKIFSEYTHDLNLENARFFSIAVCIVCLLMFFGNSEIELTYKYNSILNANVTTAFFFVDFFIVWVVLNFFKVSKLIQKIFIWGTVLSAYALAASLSVVTMAIGNGITSIAVAYLMIAVLFSARLRYLIALILINGTIFFYIASQFDYPAINEIKTGIISIMFLSMLVSYTQEKQRRKVFDSQKMLANKVDELNVALDVRSTFLGHMSHELRTPLNAIIGFSELLKLESLRPKDPKKVTEYAEFINTGGNHLLSLVNDLLDHNKIEAGNIDLSIEKLDVVEQMQNCIEDLKPISMAKNQTLKFIKPNTRLNIRTDKRRFKQIIYNLISNAQNYTHEGGLIEVAVERFEKYFIEIIIRDNGKGMPKEIIEQLKDTSAPVESHYIANAEGTGLGLIIVRQLIYLLNGKVQISAKENSGTVFKLLLPIENA